MDVIKVENVAGYKAAFKYMSDKNNLNDCLILTGTIGLNFLSENYSELPFVRLVSCFDETSLSSTLLSGGNMIVMKGKDIIFHLVIDDTGSGSAYKELINFFKIPY